MITSSALAPEPSICRLQRRHGPLFGIPVPVLERRLRVRAGPRGATQYSDQVRVVGAVELVGVKLDVVV